MKYYVKLVRFTKLLDERRRILSLEQEKLLRKTEIGTDKGIP